MIVVIVLTARVAIIALIGILALLGFMLGIPCQVGSPRIFMGVPRTRFLGPS